jgi:hypothetical protein
LDLRHVDELEARLLAVPLRKGESVTNTRALSRALLAWAEDHAGDGWLMQREVHLAGYLRPGSKTRGGRIDFALHRPDENPLAIELDRANKRNSILKLQYAVSLGWDALWIRWVLTDAPVLSVDPPVRLLVLRPALSPEPGGSGSTT